MPLVRVVSKAELNPIASLLLPNMVFYALGKSGTFLDVII
jgi:hypothetical protein